MKTLALKVLLVISCVVLGGALPAQAPVALQGILYRAEFFGPPNYGENPESDRIEHGYYLQLPASVTSQLGGGSEDLARTFFIQIGVPDGRVRWADTHVGRRVRAVGSLREAQTGHDRTAFVLVVDSIAEMGAWKW